MPPHATNESGVFMKLKNGGQKIKLFAYLGIAGLAFSNVYESVSLPSPLDQDLKQDTPSQEEFTQASTAKCTAKQLQTVQKQLPADDCKAYSERPYTQNCSLTYATKCPQSTWIEEYYKKLHSHRLSEAPKNDMNPFVGIFIGCNKGMDAIDAMRMGSGSSFFDKHKWKEAMTTVGQTKVGDGVCNQVNSPQFQLPIPTTTQKPSLSKAQLHCIEASPKTYLALSKSSSSLEYSKNGFITTHAAMSKEDGTTRFPNPEAGVENNGMANCKRNPSNCVEVSTYSLDTYVKENLPQNVSINLLSIDVEGFDMDVLLGGVDNTLHRVQYLEFEYNWMGSWSEQKLSNLIQLLDKEFSFTCYWPGFNNSIWRITGCWLDHYELHYWSNVVCVSRKIAEAREISESMEKLFLDTLEKGEKLIMNYENRYKKH